MTTSPDRPHHDASRAAPWARVVGIVPRLRGGRPVIRGMPITVGDVPGRLASGMGEAEIMWDVSEITCEDIRAARAFAADRTDRTASVGDDAVDRVTMRHAPMLDRTEDRPDLREEAVARRDDGAAGDRMHLGRRVFVPARRRMDVLDDIARLVAAATSEG